MKTIEVPPDIEAALVERASRERTTPEKLAVDLLRGCFTVAQATQEGATLFDFLKDYIGTVSGSKEPTARNASDLFIKHLEEKKRRGHL